MNIKNYLNRLTRMCVFAAVAFMPGGIWAQTYDYRTESFEAEAWATKAATVTSTTGMWTTNKNVHVTDQAYDGSYSILFSNKTGLTLPELTEGAGTLIYYAYDMNREAYVETSVDNVNWTEVESYKETTEWTKHVVKINDANAKYVRIRTTSNGQYYIDNVLLTKLDGTDGDGNVIVSNLDIPYFTQDFENTSTYPQTKEEAVTEVTYNVDGQGEWKYLNSYKSTNEAYITDGSARALRMLKGTSYVITPVLDQGVVSVSFNEGRRDRELSVYISKDGGNSWEKIKDVTTDEYNIISINDRDVNRIKIANETTKGDVDVDNIRVTAFPEGTPATIVTGDVNNVTSSSADVRGNITDKGDKRITEWGVCWATDSDMPTVENNVVKSTEEDFIVTLSGIPADTKVYCRAYVMGLAGVGYGETKTFTTQPATLAVVETADIIEDNFADEKFIYVLAGGEIKDNGGAETKEVGICYSTSENPDFNGEKVKAYLSDNKFSVSIALQQKTKYFFRAYAVNEVGISYGQQKEFTTGEIIVPEYAHNVYYCDPSGDDATADGSAEKPFYSLHKAVEKVVPGDTIFMNAGKYQYDSRIVIDPIGQPNSGMIAVFAKGGRAVLDFSAMPLDDNNQGILLHGSYWHFYGLDVCGAGDNGMLIERLKPSGGGYNECKDSVHQAHDNIIENCSFYRNQDSGLQMKNLAAYNKVINCDAYFNADPDMGDADGFAVKISHGTGNYFYGCRAWQNSDDGWDQFIKTEGGFPDDVTTTYDNCWAFDNGYLENGTVGKGNGNGFKLGSDYGRNNVIMNRCLAFNNLTKGFDQNHNTGNMILNNCTGYSAKDLSNKSHYTYRLDEPVASGHEIRFTNCVAISDGIADRNESAYAPYSIKGTQITCDFNTLPSDYKSIDPTGTDGERSEDGTLPILDFMRIADGNSKLIDKGSEVAPYAGESRSSVGIKYEGFAPDLGCFETSSTTEIRDITVSESPSGRLDVCVVGNGLLIVTVKDAPAMAEYRVGIYDVSGRMIVFNDFIGSNTSLSIPSGIKGMIMIKVIGDDFNESRKVLVR